MFEEAGPISYVMPGLEPGIHERHSGASVDGRVIGERSDAVLRTAMPSHDDNKR
jgi:hypothetical protein